MESQTPTLVSEPFIPDPAYAWIDGVTAENRRKREGQEARAKRLAALASPKSYFLSDMGNGQRFAAQHAGIARYVPEWGWLVWDGRLWRRDSAGAMRLAKETACSILSEAVQSKNDDDRTRLAKWGATSQNQFRLTAMLKLAESELAVQAKTEDFDRDPYLLNCENGILDLRVGELRPHDSAAILGKITPVEYDARSQCSAWHEFLNRIFADNQDLIHFMQRAIGYTLTGDTGERCLFLCYGTGANGKSTLLETILALLGEYGRQSDPETFLARNRAGGVPNDIARLRGARLVIANELAEGGRLAEGLVKQLTGRDTVATRFLFHEWFEFKPQFKLWVAANHKPSVKGTDNAIWDRVRLIPFAVTIPEAERDPSMPDQLRAELSGILAWAVQGCLAWQRDEGLHPPQEVRAATQAYREEMDVLANFLAERCATETWAEVTAADLYRTYITWCEASGERPLTKTRFGLRLAERGIEKERGTSGETIYRGLRLVL